MKTFWDERYAAEEFVYGSEPNRFFKESLVSHPPGKLFLPGEGEGRNAVFAAKAGWEVDCFDQSGVARDKALKWAEEAGVTIRYRTGDIAGFDYPEETYDAVGLIFVHTTPDLRKYFHRCAERSLKPGGVVILEAFHPRQLEYRTGGPPSTEMLYDLETLHSDFRMLETLHSEERVDHLNEGPFHRGEAAVVRYMGSKPINGKSNGSGN